MIAAVEPARPATKFSDLRKRALSAAVNMHHRRKLFPRSGRESVDGRHSGGHTLECADEEPDVAEHAAVLLPFADLLDLKRIAARIEIGPEFLHRLRLDRGGSESPSQAEAEKRGRCGTAPQKTPPTPGRARRG